MSLDEISQKMERYVQLMEITERQIVPPSEAEYRASVFLMAAAHVTNWEATYSELLHGAEAQASVSYKICLLRANGRNITEAKVIAEADPEYLDIQKRVNDLKDKVDYFHQYYQLFTNAHIFFRQMATLIHKESRNVI